MKFDGQSHSPLLPSASIDFSAGFELPPTWMSHGDTRSTVFSIFSCSPVGKNQNLLAPVSLWEFYVAGSLKSIKFNRNSFGKVTVLVQPTLSIHFYVKFQTDLCFANFFFIYINSIFQTGQTAAAPSALGMRRPASATAHHRPSTELASSMTTVTGQYYFADFSPWLHVRVWNPISDSKISLIWIFPNLCFAYFCHFSLFWQTEKTYEFRKLLSGFI